MNSFVKENIMGEGANNAMTENGAVSYSTIGTALLDQFGKAGSYRERNIENVWNDQSYLWAEDAESALKFPFYLRMITRKTNISRTESTDKVQKGQGARDESFKRLLWIAKYHPIEFYRNLWLLPIIGSWKDLWALLTIDGALDYLDKNEFFNLIEEGINDTYHRDLVKKFMPRIRSNNKCTTPLSKRENNLAKDFAKFAGWTYKDYRTFKSTGKAHEFQRIICSQRYNSINWKNISGKALLNLISGKFLKNHNLSEKYLEWLNAQPVAKFNGYAYELGRRWNDSKSLASKVTIDKQFDNLIATAKQDGNPINGNVLCALDTSGSMTSPVDSYGTTAYDVCVSLGIYFSELNTGAFHNVVSMFDDESTLLKLNGSFTDKLDYIKSQTTAWGSTNFQSIIDLLVDTRSKHTEIPLEDYPTTLLVVSDMQFNPTNSWRYNFVNDFNDEVTTTNYNTAIDKLSKVFPKEFVEKFKIIWWYCSDSRTKDFPSTMEHAGTYMFSGFDGAVISFLLGGEITEKPNHTSPTMEDIIHEALSQQCMSMIF